MSVRAAIDPVLLAAPRNGLVASAFRPTVARGWELGFTFPPNSCSAGDARNGCNPGTLTPPTPKDMVDYDPILLWAADDCRAQGQQERGGLERAIELLEADTSRQLAYEFWTGTRAKVDGSPNRYLANGPASNTVTTAAVSVSDGIACLEQALAANGVGRGMIHVTVGTAVKLMENRLVERQGGLLVTANDTVVVAGAGYPGTSPDGNVSSGHVWAYATDMVAVLLSDITPITSDVREAMDRVHNDVPWYATRMGAAYFDGCRHYAAELNVATCADLAGS